LEGLGNFGFTHPSTQPSGNDEALKERREVGQKSKAQAKLDGGAGNKLSEGRWSAEFQ